MRVQGRHREEEPKGWKALEKSPDLQCLRLVYETTHLTQLIGLPCGSQCESPLQTVKGWEMKDSASEIMTDGFTRVSGELNHPAWQYFLAVLLNIKRLCYCPGEDALPVFGDGVSCSQTVIRKAQSEPACAVKLAIVPVREFACEKRLPLGRGQLSTGRTCLLLLPTQTVFEVGIRNTCSFIGSRKGCLPTCFSRSGRF